MWIHQFYCLLHTHTIWKHTTSPPLLMYEDSLHPQGSSNSTGMLATCTSETRQHMLRCIVAFSLRGDGEEEEELERKKEINNRILNVWQCHCFTKKKPRPQRPKYLCQSSDWPAHGLICNANKSHSNLLHTHPWRAFVGVVGPSFASLWWQHTKPNNQHILEEKCRKYETLLDFSVNVHACDWLEDKKRLISWVRWWKCFMVSSSDSGSFSPGPKIFGKKEGRRRPRAKLASVTVRGPPRKKKNHTDTSILYFFHTDAVQAHMFKSSFCVRCFTRCFSLVYEHILCCMKWRHPLPNSPTG